MSKSRVWWPIALGLLALSVADVVTTKIGVDSGLLTEANPIVRPILGTPGYYAAKTFGVGAVVAIVLLNTRATWLVKFFYAVTAVYAVIVLSNTIQLIMAGGAS